jgi:hypothetical protein
MADKAAREFRLDDLEPAACDFSVIHASPPGRRGTRALACFVMVR